jgi:hypothetical protein
MGYVLASKNSLAIDKSGDIPHPMFDNIRRHAGMVTSVTMFLAARANVFTEPTPRRLAEFPDRNNSPTPANYAIWDSPSRAILNKYFQKFSQPPLFPAKSTNSLAKFSFPNRRQSLILSLTTPDGIRELARHLTTAAAGGR